MSEFNEKVSGLRTDYDRSKLEESHLNSDPIAQFESWYQEAVEEKVNEPNAMTLATVGKDQRPAARIVLLRGIHQGCFRFFTNYSSRKGQEVMENDFVGLNFFWPELQRQIRIEGRIRKIDPEASDAYFQSRPRSSRIGAWASAQSQPLEKREDLEQRVAELTEKYKDSEVPRPDFWGGYDLEPDYIEFWQGRASRLHDRLLFEAEGDSWKITRLFP